MTLPVRSATSFEPTATHGGNHARGRGAFDLDRSRGARASSRDAVRHEERGSSRRGAFGFFGSRVHGRRAVWNVPHARENIRDTVVVTTPHDSSPDRMDPKYPTLCLSFRSAARGVLHADLIELTVEDLARGRRVASSRVSLAAVAKILEMPELAAARRDPRALESDGCRLQVGLAIGALFEAGQASVAGFIRSHVHEPHRLLVDVPTGPGAPNLGGVPWEMLVLEAESGEPFAVFSPATLRTSGFHTKPERTQVLLGGWKLQRLVRPAAQRPFPLRSKLRVLVLLGEHEVRGMGARVGQSVAEVVQVARSFELVVAGTPRAIEQGFGEHRPNGVEFVDIVPGADWPTRVFGPAVERQPEPEAQEQEQPPGRTGDLLPEPFHVVCYLGHSRVDTGKGAPPLGDPRRFRLLLSLDSGPEALSLSLPELAGHLQRHAVRVALLCACSVDHAFVHGLLDQVEHVIAATGDIPTELALMASQALFGSLAQFNQVGDAVQAARQVSLTWSNNYAHADWAFAHWSRTVEDRPFVSEEELELGRILADLRTSALYNATTLRGQDLFGPAARHARYVPLRLRRPKRRAEEPPARPSMNINGPGHAETEEEVTIDELVTGGPVKLIEQTAGHGKSTLLRHLAWRELDAPEGRIPLLIHLARWGREQESFIVHFARWLMEERLEIEAKSGRLDRDDSFGGSDQVERQRIVRALSHAVARGRVLFLLDGVDELAHPTGDTDVREILAGPMNETDRCVVIVASRPGHTNALPARNVDPQDTALDVVHIDPSVESDDRRPYLESIIGTRAPEPVEELLQHLADNEELNRVADNAFVLCLCALVWHAESAASRRRPVRSRAWTSTSKLYEAALGEMLEIGCSGQNQTELLKSPPQGLDDDSTKKLLARLCPRDRRAWTAVLQDLAWQVLSDLRQGEPWRSRRMLSDSVEGALQKALPDNLPFKEDVQGRKRVTPGAREMAERVLARTRIISVGDKTWEFVHRSLAEFLAAQWLLREENRERALGIARKEVWEGNWEIVLKFYCDMGSDDSADDLISALVRWLEPADDQGTSPRVVLAIPPQLRPGVEKRVSVAELLGQVGISCPQDKIGRGRVDPRLVDAERWVGVNGGEFMFRESAKREWEVRSVSYPFEIQRWIVTDQEFHRFYWEWPRFVSDGRLERELLRWKTLIEAPPAAGDAGGLGRAIGISTSFVEALRVELTERLDILFRNPKPNHPEVGIGYQAAWAYCAWLSTLVCDEHQIVRLPWDEEWQCTARRGSAWSHKRNLFLATGVIPDDRIDYPWCGRISLQRANYGGRTQDTSVFWTTPVGVYSAGPSIEWAPHDMYDLCGNVWELIGDRLAVTPKRSLMRGGSWYWQAEWCRISYAYKVHTVCRWVETGGLRPVRVGTLDPVQDR